MDHFTEFFKEATTINVPTRFAAKMRQYLMGHEVPFEEDELLKYTGDGDRHNWRTVGVCFTVKTAEYGSQELVHLLTSPALVRD